LCAILHINIVRMLQKTLITMCKNYTRQDFVQDSCALKALAFRATCVEYPSSMLARFRFIFRISVVRDQPDGFSWLVKNWLIAVQLKTLNSLICFSQVQNCWRWLSLILSSSSAKKETQTKLRLSSVAVRDLFCSRPI